MKFKFLFIILFPIFLFSQNLWLPSIGNCRGQTEMNIGFHFWKNHLYIRNLQLRTNLYLIPGIRFNSVIRANREENMIEFNKNKKTIITEKMNPNFDELYLEFLAFSTNNFGKFNGNLKVGKIRYLRFPHYDNIAKFDRVAELTDLRNNAISGYYGELATLDYFFDYGFGLHSSMIYWNFYSKPRFNFIENYGYLKYDFRNINFESRIGFLQLREDPVGQSTFGVSSFIGYEWKNYQIGLLFEYSDEKLITGLNVTFAPSKTTKILGKVRLDYTRADEGLVMQIPFFKKNIGDLQIDIPEKSVLVGKIKTERVITFWRLGMMRNFYEHIIDKSGDVNSENLVVRIVEKPMFLKCESIVSEHNEFRNFNDILKWDSNGRRPGQYSQTVIYEFYRKK